MSKKLYQLRDPIEIVLWCAENLPKRGTELLRAEDHHQDLTRLQFILRCEVAVLDHMSDALHRAAEALRTGEPTIRPYTPRGADDAEPD